VKNWPPTKYWLLVEMVARVLPTVRSGAVAAKAADRPSSKAIIPASKTQSLGFNLEFTS
jgi:hypothetical protein